MCVSVCVCVLYVCHIFFLSSDHAAQHTHHPVQAGMSGSTVTCYINMYTCTYVVVLKTY